MTSQSRVSGMFAVVLLAGSLPALALSYPVTAVTNQFDDYHGTRVADPYRWLEDDHSPATEAWVKAQNQLSLGYLAALPARAPIKERLTRLWNYERYGVPFKQGGRYFIARNNGLQNQSVLYTMTTLTAEPVPLLDPNLLSTDGTVALAGYEVSDDGTLLAYGLSTAGSDWQDWKVRDVRTGLDLPDVIKWVKFSSASWTKDGRGFYYSRYDAPPAGVEFKAVNYFHKVYYHRLGTAQSADTLVYQRPDQKEWEFTAAVTEDGHYLVFHVSHGTDTRNRVFYQALTATNSPVVELLTDFDASYQFIDNDGSHFWFRTDLNAPRGKLIRVDLAHPERTGRKSCRNPPTGCKARRWSITSSSSRISRTRTPRCACSSWTAGRCAR